MTGTLGLFSLVDVFQLLSGAKRSGRLAIDHPVGAARVYFLDGRAVHAEFGELRGAEAVYALFEDERGQFAFSMGLPAPETTIEMGSENLVLESVRRLDEARRGGDAGVDPESVPEVADASAPAKLTLDAGERTLLEAVDGRRSVEGLAQAVGLEADRAARIVARLVAVGALRMGRKRARTARLVVRPVSASMPPDAVGIDPGILDGWRRALGSRPERVACKRPDGRIDHFRVQASRGAGPYLHVSHDALMRSGLVVDQALLVRPHDAKGDAGS